MQNLVLSGGGTIEASFPRQLEKSMRWHLPKGYPLKVIAPPERLETPWIGGLILGALESTIWATKAGYDEMGAHACARIPYDSFVDFEENDLEALVDRATNFNYGTDASHDPRLKFDEKYHQPEYWSECLMEEET